MHYTYFSSKGRKMVGITPFLVLSLFATSPPHASHNRKRRKKPTNDDNKRIGRRRYSRSGDKIKNKKNHNNERGRGTGTFDNDINVKQQDVYPMPELTTPTSLRPTYFTCRHTYEETLMNEIQRYVDQNKDQSHGNNGMSDDNDDCNEKKVSVLSPYPGLVRVEDEMKALPPYFDPVYALQTIPDAVVVSGDSIKNIATSIYDALLGDENQSSNENINDNQMNIREQLRSAPRGSLSIHALVPGMCKGQSKPIMLHRSEKVGEELVKMLRKGFPAARKKSSNENDHDEHGNTDRTEKWLLQFMLQSNTIAVASITQCKFIDDHSTACWPNWYHPLGLPDVNIEEKMPSSAYRKLMEGIECMRIYPSKDSNVVDLGACPGGWTSVMRKGFGSFVTAVDRSKLDSSLMKDENVMFVKGDAFTFSPEKKNDYDDGFHADTWMISDVIAYPERCTELLDNWCNEQWAENMVVTMKFQGNEPALDELDTAIDVVKGHGYNCRVKHFFNNKNEVTLMISKNINRSFVPSKPLSDKSKLDENGNVFLGRSLYRRILPKD